MYRVVSTDSVRYLYAPHRDSQAPIAVLLHGFPGTPWDWRSQVAALAKSHTVIAPFVFAGKGGIDTAAPPTVREVSEALAEHLATRFAGRQLVLVGHDIGCFFATELAIKVHRSTEALVLINGMGFYQFADRLRSPRQWLRSTYVLLVQARLVRWLLRTIVARPAVRLIYKLGQYPSPIPDTERCRQLLSPVGLYQDLLRQVWKSRKKRYAAATVPTLVVWGKHDPFLSTPRRAEVQRHHQRCDVRLLPAGHWVHVAHPERVNRLVENFLSAQRSGCQKESKGGLPR